WQPSSRSRGACRRGGRPPVQSRSGASAVPVALVGLFFGVGTVSELAGVVLVNHRAVLLLSESPARAGLDVWVDSPGETRKTRRMVDELAPTVLSWASAVDEAAAAQAVALARLPFIYPHLALMPDAHAGKGSAVGTVIPTVDAVIPAAVGVDIGCGMVAARTRYGRDDLGRIDLAVLRDRVERAIPLSPGNYNKSVHHGHTRARVSELENRAEADGVDLSHSPRWREQLGSLGGGNHFIELCLDESGAVWCFLHSGSRGVGNKIAQKHIAIAREQCRHARVRLADTD